MFWTVSPSIIRSLALYTAIGLTGFADCLLASSQHFEILVHLIGFIIRIHHDAQSSECQIGALYVQYICV